MKPICPIMRSRIRTKRCTEVRDRLKGHRHPGGNISDASEGPRLIRCGLHDTKRQATGYEKMAV
eukprot:4606648-Amphidinium_carterae.1